MTPNDPDNFVTPPTAGTADQVVTIEARGHRCPVPTLKLRRAMEKASAGDLFQLWADDPMAQIDVPHFCNQNKYLLVSTEVRDGAWLFTVRRLD